MTTRARLRLKLVTLAACFLAVAWLENPSDYGPRQTGPDAPTYVDWRTGELVTP